MNVSVLKSQKEKVHGQVYFGTLFCKLRYPALFAEESEILEMIISFSTADILAFSASMFFLSPLYEKSFYLLFNDSYPSLKQHFKKKKKKKTNKKKKKKKKKKKAKEI